MHSWCKERYDCLVSALQYEACLPMNRNEPEKCWFLNQLPIHWCHIKPITLLYTWGHSVLLSSKKCLSDRPKCWSRMVDLSTSQTKTVRKRTVLEWCENMKCLSLSACHLTVSQSWPSYHASSERGEYKLYADKKYFEFFHTDSYF